MRNELFKSLNLSTAKFCPNSSFALVYFKLLPLHVVKQQMTLQHQQLQQQELQQQQKQSAVHIWQSVKKQTIAINATRNH